MSPAAHDEDELTRQLAHLDALEQRHMEALRRDPDDALDAGWTPSPRSAVPKRVAAPPAASHSGSSLAPYLDWLASSRVILAERVAAHQAELDRLAAQWAHVVTNVNRLTPEEITEVHEGQARLREAIAVDRAWDRLLDIERQHIAAWADALGGPLTDPSLVRRLLDDVVAERTLLDGTVITAAIDALSGVSLDLDVAQRRIERDPSLAASEFTALRERLVRVGDELRELPPAEAIRQRPGEALAATLQRCVERYRRRLEVTLIWHGGEVHDAEIAAAIPWVVQECLHHLGRAVRSPVEVSVHAGRGADVALRLATASSALLPDGDPAWLVRSRARAAIAAGRLLAGRDRAGTFVEVRFGTGGTAAPTA